MSAALYSYAECRLAYSGHLTAPHIRRPTKMKATTRTAVQAHCECVRVQLGHMPATFSFDLPLGQTSFEQ